MIFDESDITMVSLKCISVVAIFGLTYVCGLLPYYLKTFNRSLKFLSYANVFSGGLFLSMALIHLLPEASLVFNNLQSLETVKQLTLYEASNSENNKNIQIVEIEGVKYSVENKDYQSVSVFPFPWAFAIVIVTISLCLFVEKIGFPSYDHSHAMTIKNYSRRMSKEIDDNSIELMEQNKECLISHKISSPNGKNRSFSPFMIMSALSIHSIFESLALGSIKDITFFLNFFLAIMLHKWAESLSLAIAFKNNNFDKKMAHAYILVFSFLAPIGIICGWILSYISIKLAAAFFSISAGTFLYITLMEVLPNEFEIEEEQRHKWIKFLLFLIGISIIAGIWFIEERN